MKFPLALAMSHRKPRQGSPASGDVSRVPGSRRPLSVIPRQALVLCLLAAIAALLVLDETAQAQEEAGYQYVDLVMTHEYDGLDVVFSVNNNGTATATGVTVLFLLEDLLARTIEGPFNTTPTIRNKKDGDTDDPNQTFIWEVGTISPGTTSRILRFSTELHPGHDDGFLCKGLTCPYLIGVVTATASSHQPEPDLLVANNVTTVYRHANITASRHMTGSSLALLLSAENLRPNAGGDLSFDLTADNQMGGGE